MANASQELAHDELRGSREEFARARPLGWRLAKFSHANVRVKDYALAGDGYEAALAGFLSAS
jgi:hypothetical protein